MPDPASISDQNTIDHTQKDHQRRRRELIIIVILTIVISALFYVEMNLPNLPTDMPILGNVIVFALININIILLLLLIFLILRNLLKLLLERKRKIVGFRLRTKLVVAFVSLSLFPTILLFVTATGFIRFSLDNWFSTNFETSLDASLVIAQEYYDNLRQQNRTLAEVIAVESTRKGLLIGDQHELLQKIIEKKRSKYALDAIAIIPQPGPPLACSLSLSPDLSKEKYQASLKLTDKLKNRDLIVTMPDGSTMIQGWAPILSTWQGDQMIALVVTIKQIPASLALKMRNISEKYTAYKKAKNLEIYIKSNYIMTFVLITALITFISIWFGFFLAKDITAPVHELALATKQIADGNLNFSIDMVASDELGILVNSFNSMTKNLLESRKERELAHQEMSRISSEHEQRRH